MLLASFINNKYEKDIFDFEKCIKINYRIEIRAFNIFRYIIFKIFNNDTNKLRAFII